ncbi:GspMb/PilO family protein [Nitrospirillum sp. BR 11752]|uniref:GspMb/PilO family protein n=1 Tax=Nitrospirillum sp. BR 11752 TaxID=3104293 RepID=UPI002EBCAFC8|nr:GspMb/PilO family protein [Nitrospirillum sp. BR 11752]
MMAPTHLRPGFVLALLFGMAAGALYVLAPPLAERVGEAMERRQARSAQLAMARSIAAGRAELAGRVPVMERVADEAALFQKGLDADALRQRIGTAIREAGGAIQSIDVVTETIANGRQRLTCHVALNGTDAAIQNTLTEVEAARPRWLIQTLRLHPAAAQPSDGPVMLTLELEIDAYADPTHP